VGVGLFREDGWRRWCRFNASVSAREGRRQNETLSKDEAEAASLSLLHWKEAWHGMATSAEGKATPGREKRGNDASWDDTNFTGPKNEENPYGRFSCYKLTVKI
jgi:hypothetical protein